MSSMTGASFRGSYSTIIVTYTKSIRHDVWPLVEGLEHWDARRFDTKELAEQAYNQKLKNGQVKRV